MPKFFGSKLFEKKVTPRLYDFAQHGILNMSENYGIAEVVTYRTATSIVSGTEVKKKPAKPKKEAPKPTPKELFNLKTLNTPGFAINCDDTYVRGQIDDLKVKLGILPKPRKPKKNEGYFGGDAVSYGRQEVESMIIRLQNREHFAKFEEDYAEWPYTTNDSIREMLDKHQHLEAIKVDTMVPDLPREAINAIKAYNEATEALCGKQPVFYLIREKEEEKKVERKRDPILLAQSPFGFFWQILGAWDKEIVYLDEL
jgi:hypothetical protein